MQGANALIESSEFLQGTATEGGALYLLNTQLVIKDSLLASNVAKAKGGAIYTSKSSIVIAQSTTFNGNRAGGTGDVVYGEAD